MPVTPMAPVAIRSPSRLSPSPLCPPALFALCFPLPEGPGPISSKTDERAVSVGGGDDRGGGGEGGGGGGAETG